ncbi:ABC-three component system protein [Sphingomonas sanguinis]|nr:ABC-three component system protein [Sphingomonas sanguinis]
MIVSLSDSGTPVKGGGNAAATAPEQLERASSIMGDAHSPFSAAEQGLGYIFQPRFALMKILELPESTAVFLEKEDDVEFLSESGIRSLGSLKHKAGGDKLTNLSTDFWKSVRVWLDYYRKTGGIGSDGRFLLFSTAELSEGTFLSLFTDRAARDDDRVEQVRAVLATSTSTLIGKIDQELEQLSEDELNDFYSRITIVDATPRITDLPALINLHLRTIRRESRTAVFERLEGWWMDLAIKMLSRERKEPIYGYEVSDKLSAIAEEYRNDNLPITFRGRLPESRIDVANDPRLFVEQLRALDLSATRIRNAIIDYYRAFEQRSSWARESLLISGEIEEYEDRLVDEWSRYRELAFEQLNDNGSDEANLVAGKELYRWAEMETATLRIRERVTEPYVVRGAFHILANASPKPRVYWHPRFLQRLQELLGIAA